MQFFQVLGKKRLVNFTSLPFQSRSKSFSCHCFESDRRASARAWIRATKSTLLQLQPLGALPCDAGRQGVLVVSHTTLAEVSGCPTFPAAAVEKKRYNSSWSPGYLPNVRFIGYSVVVVIGLVLCRRHRVGTLSSTYPESKPVRGRTGVQNRHTHWSDGSVVSLANRT